MKQSTLRFIAALLSVGLTACVSLRTKSGESVPVSVSAANYSKLSDAELYTELNAPPETPKSVPATSRATALHYYLLIPGEVYPNDVPLDTVYKEVAMVLAKRGYFDAEFEKRAGHATPPIDYFLRIHLGQRTWLNPTVRGDRITWGNDGMVANRYKTGLMSDWSRDPREGQSTEDSLAVRGFLNAVSGGFGMASGGGHGAISPVALAYEQSNMSFAGPMRDYLRESESGDYYLLVIEAFRSEDVERMDRRAPCVWTVFVAVPADADKKFSGVLRAMLQAATPYFEESTRGLQIQNVPKGNVTIGTPTVVPQKGP